MKKVTKDEEMIRVIARLDVKGPNVIKGVQLECLRVIDKPQKIAKEYYLQGVDELIYIDTVASLYKRNNLLDIVHEASKKIFIPITVGGGVRTVADVQALLSAGADKVAINTAATQNPDLITEASQSFGSQCIVASIEAKKKSSGKWEAFVDNGRQATGLDVVEWAEKLESLGAGEILLTAVDRDGTESGLDIELIKAVSDAVSIPLIASGGVGSPEDFVECFKETEAVAVAVGSILHYGKYDIDDIKHKLTENRIHVREVVNPKKREKEQEAADVFDYNRYTIRQLKDKNLSTELKNVVPAKTKKRDAKEDFDIGIIDYKLNNVQSVLGSFEKIGKKASIINTPEEIHKAKCLVLPGVGAFSVGMEALNKLNLVEALKDSASQGKPLLGICLGMQLLFSESEEFGLHEGLGLISGRVVSLRKPDSTDGRDYKIPHIGWSRLNLVKESWDGTILEDIGGSSSVYFVHTFYPEAKNKDEVVATTTYGGQEFASVVVKGNISATQFHPEKSGETGLNILRTFCEQNDI